jgi:arylsulfatase A-like enzyme
MRIRRLVVGTCLVVSVAALVVTAAFARSSTPRPFRTSQRAWNFLIIVVDTLRYDLTSGSRNTPFIQEVARRGVSFAAAYSPHDSTPPSHFSLFTGLHNGQGSQLDRLDASLAFQMRRRGYSTFGISANGNLSNTWMASLMAFAHYECLYDDWQAMTPEARAQRLPEINARLQRYQSRENEWNQAQQFCSGPEVLARFRKVLASTNRPFFGFVNLIEPHDPYLPSPDALGTEPASARGVDPDVRFRELRFPLADPGQVTDPALRSSIARRLEAAADRLWSLTDDLPPPALDTYKRRYEASVRDADQIVRSIFTALEQKGVLDRTWVVIVSDHGESFGEKGFITHSLSDRGDREATMHVPMVWRVPPPFSDAATIEDEVSLADVAPTIYDLAGIDWTPLRSRAPREFGRSLVDYLAFDPEGRATPARLGTDISDGDRKRMREESLERLRALGYIR